MHVPIFVPPQAYPPPVRQPAAPRPPAVPRDLPPPLAGGGEPRRSPEPPRFAAVAIPGPDALGVRPDDDPPPAVPIPAPRDVGIEVD